MLASNLTREHVSRSRRSINRPEMSAHPRLIGGWLKAEAFAIVEVRTLSINNIREQYDILILEAPAPIQRAADSQRREGHHLDTADWRCTAMLTTIKLSIAVVIKPSQASWVPVLKVG